MMKTLFYCTFFMFITANALGQKIEPLGPGLNGAVYKILAVNGGLLVGGNFTNAGGVEEADYLAKWNGSAWEAVAPGLNGAVHAIMTDNERIYIGGSFTDAGGNKNADRVAYLQGNEWKAMGEGLDNTVLVLAKALGGVYAGGLFEHHLANWKGNNWSSANIALNGPVYALIGSPMDLIVGGDFVDAGGHPEGDRIGYWIDLWWENLGEGLPRGSVFDIVNHSFGLYFTGDFNDCPPPFNPEPHTLVYTGQQYKELGNENECRAGSSLVAHGDYLYNTVIDIIAGDAGLHRFNLKTNTWEYFLVGWVPDYLPYDYKIALETDGESIYIGHSFTDLNGEHGDNIIRITDLSTSSSDPTTPKLFSIYPNPSHGTLSLNLPDSGDEFNYRILDTEGRPLQQGTTSHPTINVSALPSGMYIMSVFQKGQHVAEKFLID
jgi:hypothetical protein